MKIAALLLLALASAEADTAGLLAQAERLYRQLEYERVLPVAREVLERPDATLDHKLAAYRLQASCLAIIGDPIEAERPFRLLLRARPGFDMPPDTPPKILTIFRKVQTEERALAEQMRAFERQQLIDSISFEGAPTGSVDGGAPIRFTVNVRDPRGGVRSVNLHYRRATEERFSTLPMKSCPSGWCAEVPASWTESEHGFLMHYYLATADDSGQPLKRFGGPDSPHGIQVAAGRIRADVPFYETAWFWSTIAGVAVAGGAVATAVVLTRGSDVPETTLGEVPFR